MDNAISNVLKMIFYVQGGKTCTWNLADAKTDLTKTEVESFMNDVITDQVITYNGNKAQQIKEAYIYQTNKVELD